MYITKLMARIPPCTSMFLSALIVSLLIVSNTCAQEQVTQEPVEDQEAVESKRSTHSQKLEQGRTRGEYRIFLPDNRWQIVSYVADDDGYRATVRYENGPHDIPRAEQSHWGFSTGTTVSFQDDETPLRHAVEHNPANPARIPHRLNHHPYSRGDPRYGKPPYQPQLQPLSPNLPPYQGVLTDQVNTFVVHPIPAERPEDGRKQFEHHRQPHIPGRLEPNKQTFQQTSPQLSKDVAPSSSSSPTPVYIPRPYPTTGQKQAPWPTTPPPIYTAPRPEKYPDPPVYIPKEKSPQFEIKESIIYDPHEYHPFFQPKEKPKILTVQPIRPFHLPDQFYENRFNQQQSAVTNLERPIYPTQQQNQQRPHQYQHRPPPLVPQKKEEQPQQQNNRPYLDKPVSNEWTPIYQPALPYQPYRPQQTPETQESIPSYPAEPTEPYVPKQRLPFKASPSYPIEPTVEQQRPAYQPAAVYPTTPTTPAQTIKPQQRPSYDDLSVSFPDEPMEPESSYPEKPVELYEPEERPSVKPLPSYPDKPIETYESEKKPEYETLSSYPDEPVQPYQPQQQPGYEIDSTYPDKPDSTYDSERKPEYEPTVPYDEKPYEPVTAYPGKPYESVGVYPEKPDTSYELQPEYERLEKPENVPTAPYDEKSYEPVTAHPEKPYKQQTEPAPPYVDKPNEAVAPYPDRATEKYEPEQKPEYEPVPLYPDYPIQQSELTPDEEYRPQYQTDRPYLNQQTEDIRHPYRQYPPTPSQSIRPIYNRPLGNYRQQPYRRPYGVPHTGYSHGTSISGVTSIRPILNPKNQSLVALDADYSLEGEAPTEAPEFEPEEIVIASTKKPEPPRKVYQPVWRKPFRDSPIRPKIVRPFNNRVPAELPVQLTTEKQSNEQYSPLLAKYKFKGSSTSNDGYGQRTQPRRKQSSKQPTSEFTIISPLEEDDPSESIRNGYSSQRIENDNSYLVTGIPDEDHISELDSFLPIEEDFYSSNTSDSDVLYFDDGMIPPLLLRVRDKIPPTVKIVEDIPVPYAVTELVTDIATTTIIPAEIPSITAPSTETPSTTIASTTPTTKTTTSTTKPSTKAGKRKKKKRVRAKALKRGNGTGTIMPASKKIQTVSVIVKDVPPANVTLPRTSPRIRFPPRVRFVQKTAERVTRQNEKDADLIGSHSVNQAVISRDFRENDMIENHAMTKEDLMEWSLNAIPVEQLDLVYDSIELENKPAE